LIYKLRYNSVKNIRLGISILPAAQLTIYKISACFMENR